MRLSNNRNILTWHNKIYRIKVTFILVFVNFILDILQYIFYFVVFVLRAFGSTSSGADNIYNMYTPFYYPEFVMNCTHISSIHSMYVLCICMILCVCTLHQINAWLKYIESHTRMHFPLAVDLKVRWWELNLYYSTVGIFLCYHFERNDFFHFQSQFNIEYSSLIYLLLHDMQQREGFSLSHFFANLDFSEDFFYTYY